MCEHYQWIWGESLDNIIHFIIWLVRSSLLGPILCQIFLLRLVDSWSIFTFSLFVCLGNAPTVYWHWKVRVQPADFFEHPQFLCRGKCPVSPYQYAHAATIEPLWLLLVPDLIFFFVSMAHLANTDPCLLGGDQLCVEFTPKDPSVCCH